MDFPDGESGAGTVTHYDGDGRVLLADRLDAD
jgi:hypothetical protein